MASWLGVVAAISIFSMLNPVVWLWGIFLSRWQSHLGRPLELAVVNVLTLGAVIALGGRELGVQSVDWSQLIVGSILTGTTAHFAIYLVSLAIGKKRLAAVGVRNAEKAVSDSAKSTGGPPESFDPTSYDDAFYSQAMEELESGKQKKSTWARSIAMSDGNTDKAQAKYIALRVKELAED